MPRRETHVLQESLKEELVRLQKQQITTPLGVDETSEWYNSFVLVPIGKVRLCPDPARLNKGLIRPVHRSLTLYNILLRLAGVIYLILIDATSGYYGLKLDDQPSYLTTFPCTLAETGMYNCYLEWHQQVTCPIRRLTNHLVVCPV